MLYGFLLRHESRDPERMVAIAHKKSGRKATKRNAMTCQVHESMPREGAWSQGQSCFRFPQHFADGARTENVCSLIVCSKIILI